MKEMIRFKTTTSKGKIFLSPFVFEEKEAKKRIEGVLKKIEKKAGNRTELVKVSEYPRKAAWSRKIHGIKVMSLKSLILCIRVLELEWEEFLEKEVIEECTQ